MRAIRGTLADLTSPQVVSAAPNDDYLRVTITDENPPMDALAQLYAVYPNVAQFLVDNTRTKAAGVGNAVADIEDRDPLDVFEEFFEKQNGQPLDDEQRTIVADELEKAQVR